MAKGNLITMQSITLIGMPGAGKSTIGKKLAQQSEFNFVDLDALIKEKTDTSHDEIAREQGDSALMRMEESYTLGLNLAKTIFSPGGSIVYSVPAMEKLRQETKIIYLELPLSEIKKRIGRIAEMRGIVGLAEKGLDGLFAERVPLYEKFAHHTINCQNLTEDEILQSINAIL